MTDNEKILEELRKITQLLQKLNEKDRPKYETKVEVGGKSLLDHISFKLKDNEKAKTED